MSWAQKPYFYTNTENNNYYENHNDKMTRVHMTGNLK